ncbi:trypsin-like peptidase domain-containing protein [Tenacibaculum sp. M341]|uniref:trypsin-like peptidase domain-containing protein n=1 Tax=Tenacibaculum sp. M341 TaxID=2530339 RepID=UPI00104D1EC7|nr:trypsin-like peptidase domain-containing protein [Tenacibaculum sp. M341]TCI93230.1 T9SS type A sorting domain-containing protein [Tenacibaculum sp. M341]
MKKSSFFKVALAAVFLCFGTSQAQKVKIGDEFQVSEKISTKSFKNYNLSDVNGKQLVYKKVFASENSFYTKLYFENFDLAPGDYVEITGLNNGESIVYAGKGKIVDENLTMISDFWSQVLFDDKVEVKFYSSSNKSAKTGFKISKVAYGYDKETILKKSGTAPQKSICSADNKEQIACYEGTEMFEKAKAVCRLIIGGSSSCTGWLLGSEGHLMTNNHCIGNASEAQNTDFVFNYQNTNCAGTSAASSDVVASSSTFIKTSSSLDYTLVRLPSNPTGTYGYLSLSSAAPSAGDRIYIPQHPGGRRKEISVNADADPSGSGFSRVFQVSNGSGQQVRYYADTEGGSSGSPVLDYNSHLVISIHNTGGCPNGSYGKSDNLISAIGNDMPNNGVDNSGGGGNPPNPTNCTSSVSSFPYSQSFESSVGWTQASGDDGDWVRDSGGTPSSGTGPSSGAAGNFYMFLEASTNGSTGQIGANATAVLQSPCFDLSGLSSATFTFSNHMYGTSVGSLALQASTDGATWTTLWSDSGNKGNQWNDESVNLSSYLGQDEVRLRFVGTTGSSWSSDIAIDNIALTSGGGGNPSPSCAAIDFNDFTITGFSNQDSAGNFSNTASSLTLTNNTWKYIALNYTVTANTVIEFQFSSTSQGEIHGIGFEDDNTLTSSRYFKVHGTQNYGVTNYDNYTSGTQTYTIPVGSSYTGNMDRLVFINDNDGGSGNNSTFSNVRIYEGSCEGTVSVLEMFDPREDVLGNEDEDIFTSIQLAPNPVNRGFQLKVVGPNNSLSNTSYSVINTLGQVLQAGKISEVNKEINTNVLNSGVYILKLENKFTKTNKRFIVK